MISTITNIGLTEEQQKCIEYSIIYDDGTKLHAKDILKIGAKKSIKLSIKYKDDINPEYLPQEEKTIDLIFKVEYVQADETGHEKFKPIMKLYAYGSTEDYHAYKNNITKIVTKTNTSVPESAIESWDVSASGDGSVVAYVEDDGSSNGTYKVIIGGDEEKIIANEYSSYLFRGFTSLVEIDLSNFDTSRVTNMNGMFISCNNLISLDLSNFDISKVTKMQSMFSGCNKLTTTITISNSGTSLYSEMFSIAAIEDGAQITVNYTSATSSLVDQMIATKSSNSNVVKGSLVS